jgi:hypothetical protein
MFRRSSIAVVMMLAAASGLSQDVVTIGSGSGPPGAVVYVPVSILDRNGTPLGIDQSSGSRIQGFAFKVTFPTNIVQSVGFTRGGILNGLTPVHEATLQGTGWTSYLASFAESSSPIPFDLNISAPGNTIGTLVVTIASGATPGTTAALRFDSPGVALSNQSGSIPENVSNAALALVHGSLSVTNSLAAPAGLTATAVTASQISLQWNSVSGADHYELWRSFNESGFSLRTTTSATAFSDTSVSAGTTYFYLVRAVGGAGEISAFSPLDAATTLFFTDDPLASGVTPIRAAHMVELRDAVNAFRRTAGLASLVPDGTVAAGLVVSAQHVAALRTALNEARTAAGLSSLSLTDPTLTPGSTVIRAAHVQELRTAVK